MQGQSVFFPKFTFYRTTVFPKQHFQKNRKGKGLDNLRQRLELIYPKHSSLEISNSENKYATQLKITLN